MNQHLKIGCAVLAAGNAIRYGSNKLTVPIQGHSMIYHTLEAIPSQLFSQVIVVTQYIEIANIAKDFHFTVISNTHPELGISYSLQCGLSQLQKCDGVLFMVADQPLLKKGSIQKLIQLWSSSPNSIAALGHNGKRGNPCLFPARFFPELMILSGDRGGSSVIRQHPNDLKLLEVDECELLDADTPEVLNQLRNKF